MMRMCKTLGYVCVGIVACVLAIRSVAQDKQSDTSKLALETRDKDGFKAGIDWFPSSSDSSPEQLADSTPARPGPAKMPPDGVSTGTCQVSVTDAMGKPVSGVTVNFAVSYIYPGSNYRTEDGMVQTYRSVGGNGDSARAKIRSGQIRLIGTLNASSAVSDSNGIARVEYRSSHIGTDLPQVAKAVERITATLPNGSTTTVEIEVGYDDLVDVPTVPGGLRILGATGKHVQSPLADFLRQLGNAAVTAKWPQPITVTAASLRWGGQYPPHFTHKHGATLDIRPMSTDGNGTWAKQDGTSAANYDAARTKLLIKVLKDSGAKYVYFNGKDAGATPLAGHDDHIHVSWINESRFSITIADSKKEHDLK